MRIFKTVIILYLIFDGFAEEIHETYKVFRIFPRDWRDVENIATLRSMSEDNEVDFWLDSRQPGQFAEVMVSPRSNKAVREWLRERKLRFRVTINDVEKLIHQQEESFKPTKKTTPKHDSSPMSSAASLVEDAELQKIHRLRDSPLNDDNKFGEGRPFEEIFRLKGFNFPFGEYTSYATMLRFMRTIEFYYPHLAKLIRIGKTHEGRPIEGLKLGYHVSNSTKRVFWIDGNIHAREWASSHSALFIINQLVGGYGKDPLITHYMNNLNFLIIPCLNPDGYEFSRSSFSPEIRLWRKNRSPQKCVDSKWGGLRCCQGVDLNRNFDFHWAETGASTNPCSVVYAGETAFSEPETQAVHDFLSTDEYRYKLDGFITLHSYGQLFIHPYSHEVEYFPNDVRKLESVAQKAVEKLRNVYGTQYRIGTGADLLSPAAGGSDDWAKESLYTKYVYLIELRPQLEVSRGFILNQNELIPTAIETFEGIKAVIEAVLEENGIKPRPMIPRRNKEPVVSNSRVHSVPSVPMSEATVIAGDKLISGRFGGKQISESELSPFRAPIETVKQGDGFLSKATLTVLETTTEKAMTTEVTTEMATTTTPVPTTTTRKTTTTPPTTTTEITTTPSTTTEVSTTSASTTTTPQPTTESTTILTTTEATTTLPSSTTPKITTVLTSPKPPVASSITMTTSSAERSSTVLKALEALTSRPYPDTTARRLTQELLRKQLLRLQVLKTMKEAIRERMSTTLATPSATIFHAPRFLTPKHRLETSSVVSRTTPPMQLPPLIVGKPKTSSNPLRYQPPSTCVDKKYSCYFWLKSSKNICRDQERFMRANCERSCKFCGN